MAQYPPPNGYQWPNQGYQQPPTPTQQQQYMYQQPQQPGYAQDQAYPQNTSFYQNPPYPGYPAPGSAAEHYAQSQASFNHNATQLPGLGITSPTAAAPAQSYLDAWAPYGAPAAGATGEPQQQSAPVQTASYFPKNGPQQAATVLPSTQAAPVAPKPSQPKPSQSAPVDMFDDGELSEEGLFDDLYDPDPPVATRPPPKQIAPEPEPAPEPMQINDASDIDLDNAFYDEDEGDEPGEISSNTNGAQSANQKGSGQPVVAGEGRQRSASYSPDLSPREIHNRDNVFQQGNMAQEVSRMQAAAVFGDSYDGMSRSQQQPASRATAGAKTSTTGQLPGESEILGARGQGNAAASNGLTTNSSNVTGSPTEPRMTLDAAKKEAQKSILRLFPYGVKFQNYIDEGFDEEVIKSLFADLGLSTTQAPASDPEPATGAKKNEPETVAPPKEAAPKAAQETAGERAARIKQRLAAVKKGKQWISDAPATATSSSTVAVPVTADTATGSTEVSGKPKSRKETLLKQKMEQLRKARQQRDALSSARKKEAVETTTTGHPANQVQSDTPGAPSASNAVGANAAPSILQTMSSSPVGPPRKRPSAADFFYDVGAPKRSAIGQGDRPASSAVIEVAGESDDEDVEMEMEDSEAEESAMLQSNRVGTSLRDHPPLTDTHPYTRSGSSVPPTPPHGLGNGGNVATEDQYSKKMREIEEMKRKIAEIESKKPRRAPFGAQAPTGATGSPLRHSSSEADKALGSPERTNSGLESMRLPKPSDANSRQERRVRIASVQLPKVDAHIREKMAKLKIFQDKIAILQREIAQGEAEKQQLTKEMEELADELKTTPEAETASQDSAPANGVETPVEASQHVASPKIQPEEVQEDEADTGVVDAVASESEQPIAVPTPEDPVASALQENAAVPQITSLATPLEEELAAKTTMAAVDEVERQSAEEEAGEAVSQVMEEEVAPPIPEETAIDATADDNADIDMDVDTIGSAPQPEEPPAAPQGEDEPAKSPAQLDEPTVALSDTDIPDSSAEPAPAIAQISDVPAETADSEIVDGDAGEDAPTSQAAPAKPPSFTSYQSPLQYFRSYRFHPGFNADVQGGLKSLTYSSKIKPDVEFCQHELAGNDCPDGASCQFQHFANLMPQENQILVELGTSVDFAGEAKTRFVAGLKGVLQSVRTRKLRDFNSIASEIIEYRRQFLADPSKILTHLDGVTI